MTAIILDYFGDWKTRLLTCPTCGWTGTFREGLTEIYDSLEDCECPGEHGSLARPMLAILPFPTLEDSRRNWASLPEAEKAHVEAIEVSLNAFERLKLRSAAALPDLPDPVLDLLWDQEGDEVVLRLGDREVWREPVRYEAVWRFDEVLALLREKYGARLRDLLPTPASEYHLYGDKLWSPGAVQRTREGLRLAWEAAKQTP